MNYFLQPKKYLGQHFLNDFSIVEEMIALIKPSKLDHFIEIGPGLGVLTEHLCKQALRVDAIELDNELLPILSKRFSGVSHFYLHHQNALKADYHQLRNAQPLRIVGNLPYQISTPLLFHLLEYSKDIEDMHFMLQKEVVERMCAQPGNKSYGRLSVMLQYFAKVIGLFTVPASAFTPPPRVLSQVVRLIPYSKSNQPYQVNDFIIFKNIVRDAFSHRRKTIKNSLQMYIDVQGLKRVGIIAQARAEELSIAQYCQLANFLTNKKEASNQP